MILEVCKVIGHSMLPTLSPNDRILIIKIPFFFIQPKKNDIVVFLDGNKRIIKRVINVKDKTLLLMGDNQKDSKHYGWVNKKNIIGKLLTKL